MSEEKVQHIDSQQSSEEQEIDLIELAQKVWAERKLVFKACGIAVLVGLVVAFSIPKEYTTEVMLAPESSAKTTTGSMSTLAATRTTPDHSARLKAYGTAGRGASTETAAAAVMGSSFRAISV